MIDYCIVGLGLAGIAVAEELEKRNLDFRVYDFGSNSSSAVAGGLFNPVILKRFTPSWNAEEQMAKSLPFYENLEKKLGEKFINYFSIFRRFHSAEEQNDWMVASDKNNLLNWLIPKVVKIDNPKIQADFGYGEVKGTGNIDTEKLLQAYKVNLKNRNILMEEHFDHSKLNVQNEFLEYKGERFKNVIFCEGFGFQNNLWFSYLPINGNKGEYLTIHAPGLKLDKVIKSSMFIIPQGNDYYKVGATYAHHDRTWEPTETARAKILKDLEKVLKCNFEIVDQVAGLRPSTVDRRPVVGTHPDHLNLHCCNGYGSRGVLIAPVMASELLSKIENEGTINTQADLSRFTKKYYPS